MSDSSQQRYPSPLRYPGGKGKVANFIKLLFLHNDLIGHRYVEPYAGGASVALSLLFEEYASHIHINDLNRSVHAFWNSVLTDTDALCRRISSTPITMAVWEQQRMIQFTRDPDPLDLAFSTFFLNRTNRSGIIDGGVIGGKEQQGTWKLDARYNKEDLIRRIEKIGRYRSRITLTGKDATDFIQQDLLTLPMQTLVYLDPPYYVKGEGLYQHFYQHNDHVQIATLVRTITQPWLVSYDAVPEILTLYEGLEQFQYKLSYSAGPKSKGAEIMFISPGLLRPSVPSPANIRTRVVDKARRAALALQSQPDLSLS